MRSLVRRSILRVFLVFAVFLFVAKAQAAPVSSHRGGGWGPISTTKRFGIGIDAGEPYFGVNFKYFTTHGSALQFTLGAHRWADRWLGVKGEYLVHPAILAHGPTLDIPFYVGGGVGAAFREGHQPLFNVHIPVGVAFQFNRVPIDLFVQVEPGLNLLWYFDPTIGFGAGVRLFF